jgi:hypothetical protein
LLEIGWTLLRLTDPSAFAQGTRRFWKHASEMARSPRLAAQARAIQAFPPDELLVRMPGLMPHQQRIFADLLDELSDRKESQVQQIATELASAQLAYVLEFFRSRRTNVMRGAR